MSSLGRLDASLLRYGDEAHHRERQGLDAGASLRQSQADTGGTSPLVSSSVLGPGAVATRPASKPQHAQRRKRDSGEKGDGRATADMQRALACTPANARTETYTMQESDKLMQKDSVLPVW